MEHLLAERPDKGTMPQIETRIRTMCRLGELVGAVHGRGRLDYLHCMLAQVSAAHVGDLRRAELVSIAATIRTQISDGFILERSSR